jgi:hypothetical protein
MSSDAHSDTPHAETTPNAGSLGDQHVTGMDETGEFATGDEATGRTPAHGSSNAGVNQTGANRPDATIEEGH